MKKLRTLGVVLVAFAALSGSAAHAGVPVETTTDSGITWIEATTIEASDGVKVKILAPQKDGSGRSLWQTCRFTGSIAGTYKCGIDSSSGSLAQKREGLWVAKVFAGGARVGRTTFTL